MRLPPPLDQVQARLVAAWHQRAVALKMASFAMIGVVNAAVNYTVFWLVLRALAQPPLLDWVGAVSATVRWVSVQDARAIIANVLAWVVAVSGSYVMNSFITFAQESGRKLSWRAYLTFAASGLLGLLADTTTLLVATRFLPIMLAKLVAIGAGFVVNFSMSHFVVFRPRRPRAETSAE